MAFSTDTFFNGRLQVRQEVSGYRFSIDSVLLAGAVCPRPGEWMLDLGTGCGVIALIVAYRFPLCRVDAVEVQPEAAALAADNVARNRMSDRIRVLCRDMTDLPCPELQGPLDWILCNPPYHSAGSGRVSSASPKAVARHEVRVTLSEVLAVGRRMLKTRGRMLMIYPAERMADLIVAYRFAGIEPKTMRMVHSRADQPARLVIVEGIKGGGAGMTMPPPLILHARNDAYAEEVNRLFQPSFPDMPEAAQDRDSVPAGARRPSVMSP